MSEWRELTVQEMAASGKHSLATGPFGSAISSRYFSDEGTPVIRGSNLSLDVGQRLVDKDLVFIPEELANRFERSAVHEGDLIFTCWGTIGQVGFVDNRSSYKRYIVSNKQMKLTPDPLVANPLFLYYAFSNPPFVGQLQAISIGSSVPGFNLGQLRNLTLLLPPLMEQRAITEVLGALDDKIAVNDRILTTIDELVARLLDDILLCDKDVSYIALDNIAAVNQKKVIPQPGKHLRYIDISSVTQGDIAWPSLIPWEDAPGRARRKVLPGDTIWSTVRPGRKSFALILDEDSKIVVSTGFAVLTPTEVGPAFLYEITKREEFVQYLESVTEGSAYPAVRAERFGRAIIPLPSRSHLERFETISIELRRRAHSAQRESRTLAKLRDTLLPGLMSGEIRVRDVEKVVGKVT